MLLCHVWNKNVRIVEGLVAAGVAVVAITDQHTMDVNGIWERSKQKGPVYS